MRVTHAGLVEIEASEGFSSRPYLDMIANPHVWTTGFGETDGITQHTPAITRAEGERRLIDRIEKDYAWALEPFVKLPGFNQNMYDALVSFIWNCGTGAVGTGTKVGRALRARQWSAAADAMLEWNKAGGVWVEGLANRRARERKLFLKPVADLFANLTDRERRLCREIEDLRKGNRDVHRRSEIKAWLRERANELVQTGHVEVYHRHERVLVMRDVAFNRV